jgi:hypothetical protein
MVFATENVAKMSFIIITKGYNFNNNNKEIKKRETEKETERERKKNKCISCLIF